MVVLTDADRADMQGLILSGYGHLPNSVYMFLQIHDPAGARAWLEQILPLVTTAKPWPVGADGEKIKPTEALNIGFTYTGVERLGLDQQILASFAREFILGQDARAKILGDTGESAPEYWELGVTGDPARRVDVILMLYASTPELLSALVERQERLLADSAGAVVEVVPSEPPAPLGAALATLAAQEEPGERPPPTPLRQVVTTLGAAVESMPALGRRQRQIGRRMVHPIQQISPARAAPKAPELVTLGVSLDGDGATPQVAKNAAMAELQLKPDVADNRGFADQIGVPVNGLPHEQFGFPDGISQPLIEGVDTQPATGQQIIRTGEFVMGYLNAYNVYPSSPAVPSELDPRQLLPRFPEDAAPDCRDLGRNGTYLVYRKLAEHVASFWNYIQRNAEQRLGPKHTEQALKDEMNWLAAKCMGRWTSGAPMTMAPHRDNPDLGADNSRNNNFVYTPEDLEGYGCPIGSHIRRSNPRDALTNNNASDSFKSTDRHRILRRSIHFGDPLVTTDMVTGGNAPVDLKDDGKQRGIHFFAINTDFSRQFEFIQQTWCNQPTFNGVFDNKDPILGDNHGDYRNPPGVTPSDPTYVPPSTMVIQYNPVRQTLLDVPRFVTVLAGAYFFMPSVTALRYLAAPLV